jgi:hypothetical protein
MPRNHGTNTQGGSFDEATISRVWTKGKTIPNYDPGTWRYDIYGAVMKRQEHGNTSSKHGWEVDHITPVARRGTDDLSNLQPLQWENNRKKGDS